MSTAEAHEKSRRIKVAAEKIHMPPTTGKGKICYIEMPAANPEASSVFYKNVFGWNIRRRGDGAISFDDGVGEVSGAFVTGRAPQQPGFVVYIMVDSVEEAVKAVIANGGKIVQPIGADTPEITARFSDPAGNIVGLYQEPAQR
jgi:uncharacterized protein